MTSPALKLPPPDRVSILVPLGPRLPTLSLKGTLKNDWHDLVRLSL